MSKGTDTQTEAERIDCNLSLVKNSESWTFSDKSILGEIAEIGFVPKNLDNLLLNADIEGEAGAHKPSFGAAINSSVRFRVSDPIVLNKSTNKLNLCSKGVYLEKGFYRITYLTTTANKDNSGLGIFDTEKRIKILLAWQTSTGKGEAINQQGSVFVNLKEPAYLALTGNKLDFMPEDFYGTTTVNIIQIFPPPY